MDQSYFSPVAKKNNNLTFKLVLLSLLILIVACRKPEQPEIVGEVAAGIVKINVEEEGAYRITQKELEQAGLSIENLEVASLHLSQGGTAVPFLIDADAILFYGLASDSRYTNLRPYLLEVGEAGLPMAETAVPNIQSPTLTLIPQTIHLEENHLYSTESREDDNTDVWFWHKLRQQESLPVEFDIPTISNQSATLHIKQWGFTQNPQVEDDHDIDLIINDQLVETVRWDGKIHTTTETDIPSGTFKSGKNSILLDNTPEGASFLDTVHINWIEINYTAPPEAVNDALTFSSESGVITLSEFSATPILFDVSNKEKPLLLTGWEYTDDQIKLPVSDDMQIVATGPNGWLSPSSILPLRQSDWKNSDHQADLLIVTTDELAPGLEPLVAARKEQGIETAVVTIGEIYDTFGFGADSPESIQAFVRYASENWQEPKPAYLFIVGEATSDYLNHFGYSPANTVPPILVPVGYSGETTSDTRLADINDDAKPDLAVGRWPVNNLADVESLVERTLAYEQGTASDNALFAADGEEAYFSPMATRLGQAGNIPEDHTTLLEAPTSAEVADAINSGAWLTTYIGHGSVSQWGKEDVFTIDAVSSLDSANPPIVLQLTCLSGLFSHPEQTSLSETMLTQDGGPVLLIAATSLSLSSHQEPFATALLQGFVDPSVIRIGDAFQAAKAGLDVENNRGLREISDTFTLFGDPSAQILRPK